MSLEANTQATASAPLAELERQVEQAGLHTHSALSRHAAHLNRVEAMLYGLADTLLDKNLIQENELRTRTAQVANELHARHETVSASVVLRVDAEQVPTPAVEVDCAARMPICQAVCCRLSFALSASEIEAGQVRWELGRPYTIRKDAAGKCVHQGCGGCNVYENRPRVCRGYSCASDERIWKDFDRMVLNQAWIDENLVPERVHLVVVRMDRVE